MKTKVIALGAALAFSLCGTASANNGPGYDANPGREQAGDVGAQCGSGAGSGAFGAFGGKDNNFAGGANGQATGRNNSAVCGNRPATAGTPSLFQILFSFFGLTF